MRAPSAAPRARSRRLSHAGNAAPRRRLALHAEARDDDRACGGSGERYRPADLDLAMELSRRVAGAVDDARAYAAERAASRAMSFARGAGLVGRVWERGAPDWVTSVHDDACEPRGADERAVAVRVRDTGVGVAPDKLETIFEPFVQVRAELTRTAEGVGLGLAISRDLARGMGGDLTAQSTPGAGSTFTLTLPRAH